MFGWFFKLLERCGRKYVMLNERGQIIVEKYVLLGGRSQKWIKRPSVCLHHFIYLGPDPFPHTHVGNFCSFVLCGGYTHRMDDGKLCKHRRFALIRLKHYEYHDIRAIEPNTWTLFFMGKYRRPFLVKRSSAEQGRRHKDMWHQVTPELHARRQRLRGRADAASAPRPTD